MNFELAKCSFSACLYHEVPNLVYTIMVADVLILCGIHSMANTFTLNPVES